MVDRNTGMDYHEGLKMARLMKERDPEIREAITAVIAAQHGVVALKFTQGCDDMEVEILDEPYDENVRVYPNFRAKNT